LTVSTPVRPDHAGSSSHPLLAEFRGFHSMTSSTKSVSPESLNRELSYSGGGVEETVAAHHSHETSKMKCCPNFQNSPQNIYRVHYTISMQKRASLLRLPILNSSNVELEEIMRALSVGEGALGGTGHLTAPRRRPREPLRELSPLDTERWIRMRVVKTRCRR